MKITKKIIVREVIFLLILMLIGIWFYMSTPSGVTYGKRAAVFMTIIAYLGAWALRGFLALVKMIAKFISRNNQEAQ